MLVTFEMKAALNMSNLMPPLLVEHGPPQHNSTAQPAIILRVGGAEGLRCAGLAKAYVTLNVQGDGKAPAAGGVAKAVEEAKSSQPLAPNSDGGMYWDEMCAPPPATHADALAHDGL